MTDKTASKPIPPLSNAPCFIERQFPVAKISMESYKERKAGSSQTLTSLSKWWGRKPLILVRGALLGLLLPVSDNPEKDREIFLKLLTMDREGLWQRKSKPIPQARLLAELERMPPSIRQRYTLASNLTPEPVDRNLRKLDRVEKEDLQRLVFERMPYSEKLEYCDRPEQVEGPSPQAWREINAHLGTHAESLTAFVEEMGKMRFGHRPWVGDAFCGGGSVPFEAARLGCDAYGSDLNPVAALLTWASLNLIGGGKEVADQVRQAQEEIYRAVDRQVTEWGIEHNSLGWRAEAYLYCVEVFCPECKWKIPLAPGWTIAEKNTVIAKFVPDDIRKRFDIEIITGASNLELAQKGTINNSRLECPNCKKTTPVEIVRQGMRMWDKEDMTPHPEDIFQERLYCIRWLGTYVDENGKRRIGRHYHAPTTEDLHREARVLELLQERFEDWQVKGYIPSRRIEPGYNTTQPIRERGWTYWHHLFTPRQLLLHGEIARRIPSNPLILARLNNVCDFNSKLTRYPATRETINNTFSNQALNTVYNYPVRSLSQCKDVFIFQGSSFSFEKDIYKKVIPLDARQVTDTNDIWITDPPYADAVNYHELSEFFIAWQEKLATRIFPEWYVDSKRALAVKGTEKSFQSSMVDCYKALVSCMQNNGFQIVMFTHQDASVWADLTMILWASGLSVTAAWTIATETDSGLREGNYVQGTVLLVLRKRIESEPVFLDEINHKVEAEVRRQLDEMTRLEDDSDPNFGDADYQLAAYAAALRVLTERPIEEINPEKEILRQRTPDEVSPVEQLIRQAVRIACDHLVPRGLNSDLWKNLSSMERFYLKGLEVESHGEYRSGVYQELARGFGAADYTDLLESTKANETRLKSASEFGKRGLSGAGFGGSLVRQCLFAVSLTVKSEETRDGLNYLRTELPDYWANREKIIHILEYLANLRHAEPMIHWQKDSYTAGLLAGAVRNDHV